ncbi:MULTISPECIES: phage portal protein [unclassified Aeromicrobium]|uniref:phage portal protein n=1 Tax=unclassified Aeromicrobium TaxID=2633570 RepID=UPI002889789B|nr:MULTISPECIES: phage portal protein [unclassified Aeromicrobium]
MGNLRNLALQALGVEALAAPTTSKLKIPARDRAGKTPSLKEVVGLTGAYRSIGLLAGIGSGVPFAAWKGAELVERQPQIIRKPDPWISRKRWARQGITSMAVDGNMFLRLAADPLDSSDTPRPIAGPVMNPFMVHPRRKNGRQVFDVVENGKATTLSAEQVLHIRLNDFPGFDRGISPVTACRLALSGAIDTHEYASTIFDVGAIPPGILTSDQVITPSEATAAKEQWHSDDSRFIKVTGKGLNFVPVILKPEDAQWIEAQRFNVLEMARMWGIPPVLLAAAVEGSSLTYQNLQDVQQHLIATTLGPEYLDTIAAELTEITPNGQEVRHDYSGILRRGDKERMETHKIAIDAGVYDADYARGIERIPGPAPKRPATKPAQQEEPAA